jgi:tetratricopeptide (TPR) repeat protein
MFKIISYFLASIVIFASTPPRSTQLYSQANEIIGQYNGEPGGLSGARDILIKLTAMNPNSPDTLLIKAKLLFSDGYISFNDYKKEYLDESKRICKQLIKRYPKRIDTYILLASLFMNDGSKSGLEKAAMSLNMGDLLDRENIRLILAHAQLANKNKNDDRVINLSNAALKVAKKSWQKAFAHSFLTTAYRRTKNHEKAKESYLEIIKLQPKSPWALVNYSSFLRKRKDFKGAIDYAKKSLELSNFGMGLVVLSKAYYGKGYDLHWNKKDRINSRKWFQLGVDAYPDSLDSHYGLGSSYLHTGYKNHSVDDIHRAQKEYNECQKIKPGHKSSLKELKKIKKLLKRLG